MTNDILDNGEQPAVISAIMKQQTTERARIVLNEAMDIHAGASICKGYSNFLEKFYKSAPIGITVEGSNTLTRSLIIFGQGLNKSHPHIFSVLNSILSNNETTFKNEFNGITAHSLYLLTKSFNLFDNSLKQQIINYACLTNFVALKGGAIKREQMLSGDMADIFSNLYLAISVQYYHIHNGASEKLTNYIVDILMKQNQEKINKVIDNLSFMERCLLIHLKKSSKSQLYSNERDIFNEIMKNPAIINNIKKNIYVHGILKDMEDCIKLNKDSPEYLELKNRIINVGEYKNN
jgi:acyl-CoA dehydrogenase